MAILRRVLVWLGLWLAGLGGWTPPICLRKHLPDPPMSPPVVTVSKVTSTTRCAMVSWLALLSALGGR